MTDNSTLRIDLAPLQGHTDACFRNAIDDIFGGVDTFYTPFIRLEKGGKFRSRELRDVEQENNTVNRLIPQVIASTPEELAQLTSMLADKGYQEIDLNMGCPFPLLIRRHKGSGILPHPKEVKALLEFIQSQKEIKFSIKLRLGLEDDQEWRQLIDMLNDTPLQHIALHARIGKQQYKGTPNMEGFKAFMEQCKHPLLYNGDIQTLDDITRIRSQYPQLAGVMIGRGLLANPALAYEAKHLGEALPVAEKKKKMIQLHETLMEHYSAHLDGGDRQVLDKMKPFWSYLSHEMEKRTRKKIEKASKLSHYDAAVALAFSQWGKVTPVTDESEDLILD